MEHFKVRCYESGKWDGVEPHDIEAQSELEAAEAVCGGSLVEGVVKLGELRTEVWAPSSPAKKMRFRQISN